MTITIKALMDKVRELAEARPDFNYRKQDEFNESVGCSYLGLGTNHPDRGEGCIMGQALAALGVSRETLEECEGDTIDGLITRGTVPVEGPVDGKDLYWLNVVQDSQDKGYTWGEAINRPRITEE